MTEVINSIATEFARGGYRPERDPIQPGDNRESHALALGVFVVSEAFPDRLIKSDYDLSERFMEHFLTRRSEVLARSKRL